MNRPAHKCINASCGSVVVEDGECWQCVGCTRRDSKTIRVLTEALNYYRNHVVYYESRGKTISGEMTNDEFQSIQDKCRTIFNRKPLEDDLRDEIRIIEEHSNDKMDIDELSKVLKIDPNYIEKILNRGV